MREVLWKSGLLAAAALLILVGGAPKTAWAQGQLFIGVASDDAEDDAMDTFEPDEEEAPQAAVPAAPQPVAQVAVASGDSVTTLDGSRLTGAVIAAETDSSLRLAGPQFGGEVRVLVSSLDRVSLRGAGGKPGKTGLLLWGGDSILGDLVSITPEVVLIDTVATGRLSVARKAVRSIRLGAPSGVLLEGDFSLGDLGTWTAKQGRWTLADGALVSEGGSRHLLSAELPQSEAVTMVVRVRNPSDQPVLCELALFAEKAGPDDSSDNAYGAGSVVATLNGSSYGINIRTRSSGWGSGGGLQPFTSATIRFACAPSSGSTQLWVDSRSAFSRGSGTPASSGRIVALSTTAPLRIEYLAVLRGIIPPPGETKAEEGASAGKMAIEFTNGDRLTADDVALADGQFSIITSYGQARCPAGGVRCIVFGGKDTPPARPQKGNVRVTTLSGCLTLRFGCLTADALIGRSDCLGDVTLKRSAIREIKFNLGPLSPTAREAAPDKETARGGPHSYGGTRIGESFP